MSEIIPIVDENDKVIDYRQREELSREEIYRISALWIINSREQILLAQRSFSKTHSPGKWGPAVSGTVEKGESYLENIIKETKEEIGLDLTQYNFRTVDKIFSDTNWRFFCQWYLLKEDLNLEDLTFPENEVEQLKWINRKKFEKELAKSPEKFTTNMTEHYKILKKYS